MPALDYRQAGLVIGPGGPATPRQIQALQRDLRSLGYLKQGIDGAFGSGTQRAVMALQHDLLNNAGKSGGGDGNAPVRVMDYNRGRVTAVNGVADQKLVECISEMLDDPRFPKLPSSPDPEAENRKVAARLQALPSTLVPTPFLVAVLTQESNLMHFRVPRGKDQDNFIVVGADTNAAAPHVITSRGYGAGQYTLFHHPPRPEEVSGVMLDPARNVERAARLLRDKLDLFVAGATPGARADDRIAERGSGPLTLCKYAASDPRHMRDCRNCVASAGMRDIQPGLPLYPGSAHTWQPTQYYATASYKAVPVREKLGCDWPYAVRRYNGSGINSFHYQARVLKHLAALAPPPPPPPARGPIGAPVR